MRQHYVFVLPKPLANALARFTIRICQQPQLTDDGGLELGSKQGASGGSLLVFKRWSLSNRLSRPQYWTSQYRPVGEVELLACSRDETVFDTTRSKT